MRVNEKAVVENRKLAKSYSSIGVTSFIIGIILLPAISIVGVMFIVGGIVFKALSKALQKRENDFYKYKQIIGDNDVIAIQELALLAQQDKKVVLENLHWMILNKFFENVQIDSGNEFFRDRDYFKKRDGAATLTATDMVNNFFEDFGDFGNLGENMQELQSDINEMMQNMETEISNIEMDATQGNRKIIIEWNSSGRTKTPKKDVFATAVCECCGGSTRIKVGSIGVCDYCGAPIKIEI